MDGIVLIFAVLLGLIPASIASNKGHSFFVVIVWSGAFCRGSAISHPCKAQHKRS